MPTIRPGVDKIRPERLKALEKMNEMADAFGNIGFEDLKDPDKFRMRVAKKSGKVVSLGFTPHKYQHLIDQHLQRFSVLVCHRRFGKTVYSVNKLIKEACSATLPNWRGAYIAPFFKQAKKVSWDYMKYYVQNIPGHKINESELKVDFPNGARIELLGTDNPDSIRGVYLDGVVLDEVAQMIARVWGEVIRPTLADRKGWAIFIGTPQGHNLFYDLYARAMKTDGWISMMFKASQTDLLDGEELKAARAEMSPEEYQQEFECSFSAAIKGAYYSHIISELENEKKITSVPYNEQLPVYTSWDLGMSDSTVIWFFQVNPSGAVSYIDYYENDGEALSHYLRILQQKPYVYASHYGPHDLMVRELGTGKSRLEVAAEMGLYFDVAPNLPLQDGINATRQHLRQCWFDRAKCWDGIEALRHYRRDYNERRDVLKDTPLHDWTSHAADSFRYGALMSRNAALDTQIIRQQTRTEPMVKHNHKLSYADPNLGQKQRPLVVPSEWDDGGF
jgi:phage terminase large subunit